jgi:hypothetical protein
MCDKRIIRIEASDGGGWHFQDECSIFAFLTEEGNAGLNRDDKRRVNRLAVGERTHLNMGAGGVFRITRIKEGL